jgi:hypothetical protein
MSPQDDDRIIRVIGIDGIVEMPVQDLSAPERYLIGMHYNAVNRAVSTGETDDYINSEGRIIRGLDYFAEMEVGGIDGVELQADLDVVYDMTMRGELDQGPS